MLDQTLLDQDYNVGAAVPEWPELLARWVSDSAKAREQITHIADLAYGSDPSEKIDYFGDATDGPVIAFFHGGYWQGRERSEYSFVAAAYVAAGYDVAIMDYPVIPNVTFAEIVESCSRATVWLTHYVEHRRGRPAEIFLLGHSAGGHLASMAALTDWKLYDLPSSPVAGLCSISGIYDLEPISLSFVNRTLKLSPADCIAFSPMRLSCPTQIPCLFGVGTKDTRGFRWQQEELLRQWSPKAHVEAIYLSDDNHFTILDSVAYPDGAITGRLLRTLSGIRAQHS